MKILLPLLTVLFIGLKLTGHIDWSWWIVLSPTIVPLGLAMLIVMVIGFITASERIGGRR